MVLPPSRKLATAARIQSGSRRAIPRPIRRISLCSASGQGCSASRPACAGRSGSGGRVKASGAPVHPAKPSSSAAASSAGSKSPAATRNAPSGR
jgi:hypothetical protein